MVTRGPKEAADGMKTLAQHGVAFRFNGIPWFDEDGELAGVVDEPEWREEDLTPEQVAEIDALVAEHLEHRPQDSEMFARWANLDLNGVAHRHRWGSIPDYRGPGRACLMCDVWEIPRVLSPSEIARLNAARESEDSA